VSGPEAIAGRGAAGWPVEAKREAVAIAVYLCLVLAAEFVALGHVETTEAAVLEVIWGTTVGLTLAHIFAFDLAARMHLRGRLQPVDRLAVWLQLGAAIVIAGVLSIPFLLLDDSAALDVAGFEVAITLGGAAYFASREADRTRARALVNAALVLVVANAVVGVKVALSH
jgi:hypothetical protein